MLQLIMFWVFAFFYNEKQVFVESWTEISRCDHLKKKPDRSVINLLLILL